MWAEQICKLWAQWNFQILALMKKAPIKSSLFRPCIHMRNLITEVRKLWTFSCDVVQGPAEGLSQHLPYRPLRLVSACCQSWELAASTSLMDKRSKRKNRMPSTSAPDQPSAVAECTCPESVSPATGEHATGVDSTLPDLRSQNKATIILYRQGQQLVKTEKKSKERKNTIKLFLRKGYIWYMSVSVQYRPAQTWRINQITQIYCSLLQAKSSESLFNMMMFDY